MRLLLVLSAIAAVLFGLTAPAASAVEVSSVDGSVYTQAQSAPVGIGVRLVDIPSNALDDPRARSYIVDHLAPGTTIERRIEVSNGTKAEQNIAVYVGSARITDGSFVGDGGAAASVLTSWTSVDQSELIMAAGATTEVLVTVAVPGDAPEGEQYAAIWAEVRSPPDPSSNLVSASRVGIRMYPSVGSGNGPPAAFTVTGLTASRDKSGTPHVIATVTNTGGRALDLSGTLTLSSGPSGLSAGPFATSTATTLALGDTDDVVVVLGPDLPRGPWQATLTLTSGLADQTTTAEITFPEANRSVDVTIDHTWRNLVLFLAITVVLLVAAATAILVVRSGEKRSELIQGISVIDRQDRNS